MKASRESIKMLIQYSETVEEAKKVIDEFVELESIKEKIAYLKGMFDFDIIDGRKDDPEEVTYELILTAVIESKFI